MRPPWILVALVAIALGATSPVAASTDLEARFRDANAAFAAGDYDAAAADFRSILSAGHVSTALLYDLANAESKAGHPGAAVLNYERALSLSPRDPDVLANLRQTRAATNLPEPQRGRWRQAAGLLTVDGWAWLAAGCLWTVCLLLAGRALRRDADSRPGRSFVAGVAALALGIVLAAALAITRLDDLERGVVMGPRPALRVAPFEAATVSAELVAGQIVELERFHDAFVLVRTSDDQAGWMARSEVEQILAP